MTLAGRRKLFSAAVITLNIVNVFWALVKFLEGASLLICGLSLLLGLVLLNAGALVLWRGGELSQSLDGDSSKR
jgi:hypothetical protein